MRNFLNGKVMAGIWMVLRIWLGVQWLQAGWGNVLGGFDAGGYLNGAIAKAGGEAPIVQAWYGTFLETLHCQTQSYSASWLHTVSCSSE